jgi:hypothetical protein
MTVIITVEENGVAIFASNTIEQVERWQPEGREVQKSRQRALIMRMSVRKPIFDAARAKDIDD